MLPTSRRAEVASHVASCPACRKKLDSELKLLTAARVSIANQNLKRDRLRILMPAVPVRRAALFPRVAYLKQIAFAAALVFVLIIGLDGLNTHEDRAWAFPAATEYVATETSATTPAASIMYAPAPLVVTFESDAVQLAGYDEGTPLVTPAPAPADMRN
jgi:anti-sigma factor RsiW